jgi:Putative transmembrane protein 170
MSNQAPLDYTVPSFPSLYIPIFGNAQGQNYLYHLTDVWRFTLFWTLILYGGVHFLVAGFAVAVQWRNWRTMWTVPVVYMLVAILEALLAGSLVGLM